MKSISNLKTDFGRPSLNVLRLASNVADTETIVIGNETYEIDTAAAPGAITAGRIRVDCNAGVTPTIASAAIVAAINNNTAQKLFAVAISVNEILIACLSGASLAATETLAGANNAFAAAAFYGGVSQDRFLRQEIVQRAAIAQEVTLDSMHFYFDFTPTAVLVQIRTSAGALKTWDGAITITGRRVTVGNGGSVDWAAGDIIAVVASE